MQMQHFLFNFTEICPIDNKSAMVQVPACRLIGAKPLRAPKFTDAYMQHEGKMGEYYE